jgi:hypothetical protein
MAIATAKTAKHGRNRTLGVKTWLGAGALTLGVGAALAGAAGVAQADTGDHQGASSTSTSKHDAGPQRSAGMASSKRVTAPSVKAVSSTSSVRPAAASVKPAAAASPVASQTSQTTQTVPTPFGPITVVAGVTAPDPGTSGDVSLSLNFTTPVGSGQFSLSGAQDFSPAMSTTEIKFTGGTLVAPASVAFLVSSAGPAIVGGNALNTIGNTFVTDLQHRNIIGAISTALTALPTLVGAVLVGQNVTVPINVGIGDPAQLNIPVGGIFAPLRPVTVTWSGASYVDPVTGDTTTFDPINITFTGTKFGGSLAGFGQLIGLL